MTESLPLRKVDTRVCYNTFVAHTRNKTQATQTSVRDYIASLPDDARRDAKTLLKIFKDATGAQPVVWGAMVGFGNYHYVYDSGREGDFFATGFALRKSGPVVYIMPGYTDYASLLTKLGPHTLGKSCLYIKRLEAIDADVLTKLIKTGIRDLAKKYPVTMK